MSDKEKEVLMQIEITRDPVQRNTLRPMLVRGITYKAGKIQDIRETATGEGGQAIYNAVRRISRLMLGAK